MPVITERPVVSLIADEILSRLETLITEPNDAFLFRGVIRPTRLATYTPEHGLIVLTKADPERVPELDCPGNPPAICYQQTFRVCVHIAPSEKDDTPVDLYEEVAEAAIHKAIRANATWHQFDGNAINAEFLPSQVATKDGGYEGLAVPIAVTYRISEGDPYTVRA